MSLNMIWFWHHVRVLGKLKVNFLFTASATKCSLPYRRTEDLVSLFAGMVIQFPSKTVIMPSFQHVSPQNQPVKIKEWADFVSDPSLSTIILHQFSQSPSMNNAYQKEANFSTNDAHVRIVTYMFIISWAGSSSWK
mgnify:CR=1 FL=1